MKNNLSDLKIMFAVTSLLMLMIVISSMANPCREMSVLEDQYSPFVFKDTSFVQFSKKYPEFISYVRQQDQLGVTHSTENSKVDVTHSVEKKKRKVYYWITYKKFGEDEGPAVNASYRRLEWCSWTLQHRTLVNSARQMKEPIPLKIKVFHF